MKQLAWWRRGVRSGAVIVVISALFFSQRTAPEELAVSVSFEQPFAQTRIKTVVDAYMRLWSDLEFIASRQTGDQTERQLAFEAAIGRATFVGWAVDQLLRQQQDAVGDGLQYMCHATMQMNELASTIKTDSDHARCMHELLGRVWQRLSCGVSSGQSLQGNDAAIGAG